MRRVYQEPLDGKCFQACVASLFDLDKLDTPLFGGDYPLDATHNEAGESLGLVNILSTRPYQAGRRS